MLQGQWESSGEHKMPRAGNTGKIAGREKQGTVGVAQSAK
jgi:hypothetical protein